MTSITGSFKDAIAVIHDSNNNFIAKTTITAHDKKTMIIEIDDKMENVKTGTRLNLLIIHSSGASDFSGTLRKSGFGTCEISLFGERERKGRSAVRHTLNIPATIKDLMIKDKQESFREPLQVTIENLSTTGTLVRSPLGGFEKGYILQIEFNINGKDAIIYGEVIREQKNKNMTFSYGCKLIFL